MIHPSTVRVCSQILATQLTRSVSFEVALFAVVIDATLEIAEELKPEAQAKPSSCITASLALQASIAGLSAKFSTKSATSKRALQVRARQSVSSHGRP